jgi:hypothetical protein
MRNIGKLEAAKQCHRFVDDVGALARRLEHARSRTGSLGN